MNASDSPVNNPDYNLEIEYLTDAQDIDEEQEFRAFCATLIAPNPSCTLDHVLSTYGKPEIPQMDGITTSGESLKETVRPMAPFVADVFYQNISKPPPSDDATVNSTNSSNSSSNKRQKTTKKPNSRSVNLAQSKHKKSNNNKSNSSTTIASSSPTSMNHNPSSSSSSSSSSNSRSNSIVTVNSSEPSEFSLSPRSEDIRLTYARIFMEAFNNFERVSQREQLFDFCTHDCMLTVKWTGEQGNPCGPDSRVVQGVETVLSFMDTVLFSAVPDALFQLLHSKLKIKLDGSSYIICTYTFSGTQIYKIERTNKEFIEPSEEEGYKVPHQAPVEFHGNAVSADDMDNNRVSIGSDNGTNKRKADGDFCAEISDTSELVLPVVLLPETASAKPAVSNQSSGVVVSPNGVKKSMITASEVVFDSIKRADHTNIGCAVFTSTGTGDGSAVLIEPVSSVSTDNPENGTVATAATAESSFQAKTYLTRSTRLYCIGTLLMHINSADKITKFEFIQENIRQEQYQQIVRQYKNTKTV